MVLFEDDTLVVRRSEGLQGATCVLSFSYRFNRRKQPYTPAERGFAEDFLIKRGMPHICFIAKQNHWWQAPSFPQAIQAAWDAAAPHHQRYVSYGASMGGYGAMLAASFMRLDRIIAFYPQASIRADLVDDGRWRPEQDHLPLLFDDQAHRVPETTELFVLFDRFQHLDHLHVRLLRAHSKLTEIQIGLSGHYTLLALREIGLLTSLMERLIAGDDVPPALRAEVRRRRQGKSLFYRQAAENLALKNHHLLSRRYARRATSIKMEEMQPSDR